LRASIALEAVKADQAGGARSESASFPLKLRRKKRVGAAVVIYGEVVWPLDWLPGMKGAPAQMRRVPRWPVSAFTPLICFHSFLVAHKVGNPRWRGNPIILRSYTPGLADPVSSF